MECILNVIVAEYQLLCCLAEAPQCVARTPQLSDLCPFVDYGTPSMASPLSFMSLSGAFSCWLKVAYAMHLAAGDWHT